LSFDDVVAGYGGGDVLKRVNFVVQEGGVTCIVGPNGSGKSTLLKTVSGLLRPRLGQILFKGTPLVGKTPREILKMGIVQVPQQHSLFKEMTVEENVSLGAFLVRDRSEVSRRLESVREIFPIVTARAKDKAGSLSGGQQRLVEFARCLMLEPELVVLDERNGSNGSVGRTECASSPQDESSWRGAGERAGATLWNWKRSVE
jgi:branched-chain amino acid transport system ATP-binding protein